MRSFTRFSSVSSIPSRDRRPDVVAGGGAAGWRVAGDGWRWRGGGKRGSGPAPSTSGGGVGGGGSGERIGALFSSHSRPLPPATRHPLLSPPPATLTLSPPHPPPATRLTRQKVSKGPDVWAPSQFQPGFEGQRWTSSRAGRGRGCSRRAAATLRSLRQVHQGKSNPSGALRSESRPGQGCPGKGSQVRRYPVGGSRDSRVRSWGHFC